MNGVGLKRLTYLCNFQLPSFMNNSENKVLFWSLRRSFSTISGSKTHFLDFLRVVSSYAEVLSIVFCVKTSSFRRIFRPNLFYMIFLPTQILSSRVSRQPYKSARKGFPLGCLFSSLIYQVLKCTLVLTNQFCAVGVQANSLVVQSTCFRLKP